MRWTYWDNSEEWHGHQILTIVANDISEADWLFRFVTTNDSRKRSFVGVTCEDCKGSSV